MYTASIMLPCLSFASPFFATCGGARQHDLPYHTVGNCCPQPGQPAVCTARDREPLLRIQTSPPPLCVL
jgi:hypothetical protein